MWWTDMWKENRKSKHILLENKKKTADSSTTVHPSTQKIVIVAIHALLHLLRLSWPLFILNAVPSPYFSKPISLARGNQQICQQPIDRHNRPQPLIIYIRSQLTSFPGQQQRSQNQGNIGCMHQLYVKKTHPMRTQNATIPFTHKNITRVY